MYVNGEDSGGSFEFLGTACSIPEEGVDREAEVPKVAIDVRVSQTITPVRYLPFVQSCATSMEDIPVLVPVHEGEQFFAVCPRTCSLSPDGYVYGTDTYAPESSICKAALHSGACAALQACRVLVTVGSARKSFQASSQHGILSYAHGPSESSLGFSNMACAESLLARALVKYKVSFGTGSSPSVNNFFTQTVCGSYHTSCQGWLLDEGKVKHRQNGVMYGKQLMHSIVIDRRSSPVQVGCGLLNKRNALAPYFQTP
ncbi:PA14 domain-containing protein [Besnoitia besnoiti]|uniref:PA14 domain-containing protein n=1 Tax=Besnoitia besnoiti TaxID=94643 RepID=A0A2A9M631_BESBE|nr:PA14 domain-containing protein [Besnoitia besnoiti]PFH33425.1 PA14 domain-containing protein [Besnoitia besnoiti]